MEISHTETAAKDGSKGQLAVEYISASLVKPYKTNPKNIVKPAPKSAIVTFGIFSVAIKM